MDEAPPYALTRAPQGAKLADRQSRIRSFLDHPGLFRESSLTFTTNYLYFGTTTYPA